MTVTGLQGQHESKPRCTFQASVLHFPSSHGLAHREWRRGLPKGVDTGKYEKVGGHYHNILCFKMWYKTYEDPEGPDLSL